MRTLIITSTVYVNSDLTVLIDVKERVKQYLLSILFYLDSRNIDQIIICDNSNFDYSKFDIFFTSITSKKLEYLSFEGDKAKISTLGKGYGEGEIMEYVMKNSQLINFAHTSFLKVTGRLKVLNIDDILASSSSDSDSFHIAGSNPFANTMAIDTRFYQCTSETYRTILINEYRKVDDKNGSFLEHCYYNKFKSSNIKAKAFPILPKISGLSGSTGINYDDSKIKWFVKKVLFFFAKKMGFR